MPPPIRCHWPSPRPQCSVGCRGRFWDSTETARRGSATGGPVDNTDALGLLAHAARGGRRQVQLVVADPTDDLHQARELRTALTAATNLQPWQATRDNVVAALPKDVGRHGIFVYSGHVSKSDPAAPASAALRLGHDPDDPQSWLEAKDFLHATSPGMWDRVLLSGCSSAGAEASAEWLGLAPAMLWAGADRVATTWDLLDSVDTTALELAMIEALRGDDPVRELADIQRAHLDQWRGSNAETACPPVIFGAFAGVSVCPGRPATVGLE